MVFSKGKDKSKILNAILLDLNLTWQEYELALLCQTNYEEYMDGFGVYTDHCIDLKKLFAVVENKLVEKLGKI